MTASEMKARPSQAMPVLGDTRDGQRILAVWWGDLAIDFARHGSAANACAAASTAAHLGRLVIEAGGEP